MSKKYDWLANTAIMMSLLSLIKYSDNYILGIFLSIIILISLEYKYGESWFDSGEDL